MWWMCGVFALLLVAGCERERSADSLPGSWEGWAPTSVGGEEEEAVPLITRPGWKEFVRLDIPGILPALPGSFRPFSDSSIWNQVIPANPAIHDDSDDIIPYAESRAVNGKIRFNRDNNGPIWVIDYQVLAQKQTQVSDGGVYLPWDLNQDGKPNWKTPLIQEMYPEYEADGHITVVSMSGTDYTSYRPCAWEMSRYKWNGGNPPLHTTWNLWEIGDTGEGHYFPQFTWPRWQRAGGRGSGCPMIAGMLRPEEVETDNIRHALAFTFPECRGTPNGKDIFMWPPACRSDGGGENQSQWVDTIYPIQGMLFQLDPALDDTDFNGWGLGTHAKKVARALQTYGAYCVDVGGAMGFSVQLLGTDRVSHRQAWDTRLPNLYDDVAKIPVDQFRVISEFVDTPTIEP